MRKDTASELSEGAATIPTSSTLFDVVTALTWMGVVPLLLKVLSRGASGGCHDGLVVWDKYPHGTFTILYLSPVDRVPPPL